MLPRYLSYSLHEASAGAMSVSCGLECVVCLGCARWAWRRLTYTGADDSASWPPADVAEFEPVPRACRAILAAYEPDLSRPRWAPSPAGYRMDPAKVVKRATHNDTGGRAPPYLVYADAEHREVVLAVRGLSLVQESDYKLLLDDKPGMQAFDGGYVHHGLLKAAVWLLNREAEALCRLLDELGADCKLVFAGHSLGAGVAALMAVVVVNQLDRFRGIPRSRVRCYAVAPARCMSLNLAIKYADIIHSVVLQDDFLPRTPTPLQYIFGSIFCLPCFLFLVCMRDTFTSEDKKLRDPRRLYAPGRMYHIVERKFCRCGRFPPEVRTAIPVEGRFEHIVLSCNATVDHSIVWIEREAQKALERMNETLEVTAPPVQQRMDRKMSSGEEHKVALEKAMLLDVPYVIVPTEEFTIDTGPSPSENQDGETSCSSSRSSAGANRDELVEELPERDEPDDSVLKTDVS